MVRLTRTWRVAGLLFGSGFCALVYQICWLREFRLVFGASTAASAAVLAIFTAGLGIGGLVLGSRVDRRRHPLRVYATLEAIIAVAAATSPFLLALVRSIYIWSGGSTSLGVFVATGMRLGLCSLVLAVPTFAMGGTLPAAARAATQFGDRRGHAVAALYALNTLGAVAGTLLSTFFLLERLGTRGTLWLAAAINLAIAIVAASDRSADDLSTEIEAADADAPAVAFADGSDRAVPTSFLLLASGTVGFAFFLMELVWYRLLAPLLGGSVFTFGLVLAVALLGIGLGGLAYALVARQRQATLSAFATTCLLEAICVAGTFALGDRIALMALRLQPPVTAGFAANMAGWTLVASLVVLPPALVAGFQFPLLIALFGRGRARLGREVGLACAANTVGAIGGSLAGGFGLLPWLSAQGAWRFVGAMVLLLGLAAAARGGSFRRWRLGVAHIAMAVTAVALLLAEGPSPVWRHSGVGARRAPRAAVFESPNNLRAWEARSKNAVVWEGDGVESGIALISDASGYAFIVNGKSDGSARADAGTQVMLGLIAALKHPNPKSALVVGLGTGSSAGWLAAVPSIERVDVVELEPLVLDVARACHAVNRDVMHNPKVSISIGDAREALLTGRERYDIIASEPSNPFRAGIASLFTQEFYRAASQRLTIDGVFAQWVQSYEIDGRTLATIYATMQSVFPEVETWETMYGDLLLMGTSRARPYDLQRLANQIAEEPYRSAIHNTWRALDLHSVLAHYVGGTPLARALPPLAKAVINTDDRNSVEFGLARSVGRPSSVATDLRTVARQSGAARPQVDREEAFQWTAVDTAWVSYISEQGGRVAPPLGSPEQEDRRDALRRYLLGGDTIAARVRWRAHGGAPLDLNELSMLADAEAEAGDGGAIPLIEQLRVYQPGEADTIVASLRLRQGRNEEAAEALERAFAHFRVSPWTAHRYERRALEIARVAALPQPLTRRLFDALEQPFANRTLDEQRLTVRLELAMKLSQRDACLAPVTAFGGRIPWTEHFLRSQRDCYQMTRDGRLGAAARRLTEFLAYEPPSLPADVAAAAAR